MISMCMVCHELAKLAGHLDNGCREKCRSVNEVCQERKFKFRCSANLSRPSWALDKTGVSYSCVYVVRRLKFNACKVRILSQEGNQRFRGGQ